jgi:hypothetical protein
MVQVCSSSWELQLCHRTRMRQPLLSNLMQQIALSLGKQLSELLLPLLPLLLLECCRPPLLLLLLLLLLVAFRQAALCQ